MIYHFVVDHAKLIVLGLVISFVIIKYFLINAYGLKEKQFHLFIISMNLFSKPVIQNTYPEELQRYYKVSNKINLAFYIAASLVVVMYILFKFYFTTGSF